MTASGALTALLGVVLCFLLATPATAESTASTYPPIDANGALVPPACTTTAPTIAPVPVADVASLEASVRSFLGSRFQALGQCGNGLLILTLTPGSEPLAARVRAQFGPQVQIMVGPTVWDGGPGRSPTCGVLAPPSPGHAAYTSMLVLRSRTIRSGANLNGFVTFRDTTSRAVLVTPGEPLVAVVTKPGTRRVVGIFAGGIAGTGFGFTLRPGGRPRRVAMVGGTARCDGGIGSALPPGRYDVVVEVSGPGVNGIAGYDTPRTVFTQFVPIRVVRSARSPH